MSAHAILSASASKRWLTCTPSARLEAALPPEPKRPPGSFDYSQEGTKAHTLAEAKLRYYYNQIGFEEFQKEYEVVKNTPYYNEEFEHYVDDYVLYVRSQIGEGDRPLFEQRVDFSDWVPDGFGTADVIILSEHKIRVIDLKFGKGIPVSAKDNTQLRLYALGAYAKFREEIPTLKEVEYTIHQPRLESISTDGTTVTKLVDWANYYVKPKAKRAWAGTGEFLPGDHCQFCKAKTTCRARSDFVSEVATLDFKAPALLTDEELEFAFSRAANLRTYVNDLEAYFTERAIETGNVPKGYLLVPTKTHRKITDTELAVHVLLENNFNPEDIWETPSLKSVAKLEKLSKKGHVASLLGALIVKPDGPMKLVKDKNDAAEDFK
jgi:hypothetical protein